VDCQATPAGQIQERELQAAPVNAARRGGAIDLSAIQDPRYST
jgi:hypothetical protein